MYLNLLYMKVTVTKLNYLQVESSPEIQFMYIVHMYPRHFCLTQTKRLNLNLVPYLYWNLLTDQSHLIPWITLIQLKLYQLDKELTCTYGNFKIILFLVLLSGRCFSQNSVLKIALQIQLTLPWKHIQYCVFHLPISSLFYTLPYCHHTVYSHVVYSNVTQIVCMLPSWYLSVSLLVLM